MKIALILSGFVLLAGLSVINFTSAYTTDIEDGLWVFVQTTIRNSDGQLIVYLESSKFTDLNLQAMDPFLDFEASRGNDPIVSIDGKEYQVIRRVQTKTFTEEDLVASTILSNMQGGKVTQIARFAHDGYPVYPGDKLESMWTFVRIVS